MLDFPRDIEDFIRYAGTIHESMRNCPLFAGLAAKLVTLLANIGNLRDIETEAKSKPPTKTIEERNAALTIVQNNLRTLRNDVQTLADADIPNAEVIITTAGMKVKKQGEINKQNFTARNGKISGTVDLTAKGVKERSAHDWVKSVDNEVTWITLTPTLAAHTTDTGLTKGDFIMYRHRTILKDGPTD